MFKIKNFSAYFFLLILTGVLILLYKIFQPFLNVIFLAAVISVITYPLYKRLTKHVKNEVFASLTMCLLILAIIVIPAIFFIKTLVVESIATSELIKTRIEEGFLDPYINKANEILIEDEFIGNYIENFQTTDLTTGILNTANKVAGFLVNQSAQIFKNVFFFLFHFLMFFIVLFFLFKDGHKFKENLLKISPLPDKYNYELSEKFKEVSQGTIYGILFTSIIQGIIGGFGFFFVGIPAALVWGTFITFAALIPAIGTGIVWLPAVIILFIQGNIISGLFLFFWSLIFVSTADNVIRSYFIKGKIKMHPLLTFFSLIGGFLYIGLIGLIIGPLILVLSITLLHIFTLEYNRIPIIK